jgi:hypothetical protein
MLARPLGMAWTVVLVLLCAPEIVSGNVHVFIALAIVAGFRYPGTWALVLLTKVAPGVGLLWFALRREWRPLGVALGVTGAIATLSYLTAPGLWHAWLALLLANTGVAGLSELAIPLIVRVPVAAAVVTWGARTDRAWTVPVAATLTMPALYLHGFTTLLAVIPLALAAPPVRDPTGREGRQETVPA